MPLQTSARLLALLGLLQARTVVPAADLASRLGVGERTVRKDVERVIEDALHDAVEASVANVPELSGDVHVFVDVSGSMRSPVTGHRAGATTAARCVDVAALYASSVLRKVRSAHVVITI